ncbi:MAG: hypothetical protein JWR83_64, partial [Aeromicrobium sp.]|nr:hypothetical protein [Aeromicrobium sp.]
GRATNGAVQQSGSVLSLDGDLKGGGVIRVSADAGLVEHTLAQLRWILAVSSLAVLIVATALLLAVVRRSLSPLGAMTRVAQSITSGDRGRRLRPDRPRTEIGRTASAFDAMLDEVEGAERSALEAEHRMREFLSDAAHELRTPLTGMQAAAESLLRDSSSRSQREELAVHVVREAQQAARLVDDMLMMARVDRGLELVCRPFDLVDEVRTVAERLALRHPDLLVTVEADRPVAVSADVDRIAQVISNLTANASRVAGRVTILVRRADERAVVEVSDNGPGVPLAEQERIFERLVRLDRSRDRHAGGVGLGLPIARGIARAHGGELACVASETGATFRLELPVADPAHEQLLEIAAPDVRQSDGWH